MMFFVMFRMVEYPVVEVVVDTNTTNSSTFPFLAVQAK